MTASSPGFGRPVGVAHLTPRTQTKPDSDSVSDTQPKSDPTHCQKCGASLSRDEIGLTKKLVNRAAESFFCTACLCEKFAMTREDCETLIDHFRQAGCHFFN